MIRRSKRARLGNLKRNINIVLITIYLFLGGFLLFLIFKHNILAFRYLNILTAVLIFISAVIAILLIVYKKAEKFTVFFLTLAIVVSSVSL
ncbi:MAG: LytR family transcriptional regulator, partial [Streptococcus sp.]|nr:LytR family transcriptional regulator [Streptococcus sp.]